MGLRAESRLIDPKSTVAGQGGNLASTTISSAFSVRPNMTKKMTAKFNQSTAALGAALVVVGSSWLAAPLAWAQNFPVTPAQQATANQVAQAGVPLSELAANAPDNYTVQRGDTLWAISTLFLKSPWRWPELWGMNLAAIKNPHLIYPGQTLYLEKKDGRATLSTKQSPAEAADRAAMAGLSTVRLSPRVRSENLPDDALPTLKSHLLEPFLVGPAVVDENGLKMAPRIVATQEGRVLLSRGDRAYARSQGDGALTDDPAQKQKSFRLFRNTTALTDPVTGEVLGYEAPYVGKALLVRGESIDTTGIRDGKAQTDTVPASIDIVAANEEVRVGDRLLPEPERLFQSYVPHAPAGKVDARIMSIYGNAVANAGQNQVVTINRGTRDGLETGHVLAILKSGKRMIDPTDPARTEIKLPDERNGLLLVFRSLEKLSYGLILEITDGVKVGDRLINPR